MKTIKFEFGPYGLFANVRSCSNIIIMNIFERVFFLVFSFLLHAAKCEIMLHRIIKEYINL
jgi:hypothetical protein